MLSFFQSSIKIDDKGHCSLAHQVGSELVNLGLNIKFEFLNMNQQQLPMKQ